METTMKYSKSSCRYCRNLSILHYVPIQDQIFFFSPAVAWRGLGTPTNSNAWLFLTWQLFVAFFLAFSCLNSMDKRMYLCVWVTSYPYCCWLGIPKGHFWLLQSCPKLHLIQVGSLKKQEQQILFCNFSVGLLLPSGPLTSKNLLNYLSLLCKLEKAWFSVDSVGLRSLLYLLEITVFRYLWDQKSSMVQGIPFSWIYAC